MNNTRPSTAPAALRARARERPKGPKHDSLCIETYQESHAITLTDKNKIPILDQSPEDVPKLSRCYCMCGICFQPTGQTRHARPRPTGRCICRSCPCREI